MCKQGKFIITVPLAMLEILFSPDRARGRAHIFASTPSRTFYQCTTAHCVCMICSADQARFKWTSLLFYTPVPALFWSRHRVRNTQGNHFVFFDVKRF